MAPDIDQLAATLAEAKRIADGLQFACRIPDKVPEPICGTCHRGFWPCATYRAIAAALAGEGAGTHG